MDIDVFTAVLFAALLHAAWNVWVKLCNDKYVAVAAIVLGHIPASLIIILFLPLPNKESVPFILLSALVHQGYQWFLLAAYRHGDYIKVYPIARGFGPLVVTCFSILFFSTQLNSYEFYGILIVCLGIFGLSFHSYNNSKKIKAITFALFTGLFIGMYSIIDGYGARISMSPLSFISWSFVFNGIIFVLSLNLINKTQTIKKVFKKTKMLFLIGGTASYITYAIVVWAFTKAPIPLVATLRETSIVVAIILSSIFIKEHITIFKIISIFIIFIGVACIKFF